MQNDSVAYIKMKKVSVNEILDTDDELAVEDPLEIHVRYDSEGIPVQKCISVTMRTPGNDEELGVGFLFIPTATVVGIFVDVPYPIKCWSPALLSTSN